MAAWVTSEDVPGGKRFIVRQSKWHPLIALAVLAAIAASFWFAALAFFASSWVTGLVLGFIAVVATLLVLTFGLPLLLLTLVVRSQAAFTVTAGEIRLEQKNSGGDPDVIPAASISRVHQGAPGRASEVGPVGGIFGDVAEMLGAVLGMRAGAVWLQANNRDITLARQIPKAEAAALFKAVTGIIRLE